MLMLLGHVESEHQRQRYSHIMIIRDKTAQRTKITRYVNIVRIPRQKTTAPPTTKLP